MKTETGYQINDESPDGCIKDDFGIYGDEAVDFLIRFSKELAVDISRFNFNEHFSPEADKITRVLTNAFIKRTRKKLMVSDLKSALLRGKLERFGTT